MSDLIQRDYYRIFSGGNQKEGYNNLYLGYESKTTEIYLKKNTSTYFHVPFFSASIPLQQSSLIGDGATPGSIPILADRIFQKQGSYPKYTPIGNPGNLNNGTWLCSWLYSLSGESPRWLDRFYNPGKLTTFDALQQTVNSFSYEINNPAYYDVPTTMVLVPGTWIHYYHNGEKDAAEFIKTLSGKNNNKLRLHINEWGPIIKDKSTYNNIGYIENFNNNWNFIENIPEITDKNTLNFNNTDFIDTRVVYNSSYNLQDEFTLNFWVNNSNWLEAPGTQLVGNINGGGFGAYFNNLKYYPYFVVPENFYGHVFYFNGDGFNFLDKNTQPTSNTDPETTGTSNPVQVAINSNNETIVLDSGLFYSLYKLDHQGSVIATARDVNNNILTLDGEPKILMVDKDDKCIVITVAGTYIFDADLNFINFSTTQSDKYVPGLCVTFNTNGNLLKAFNCKDFKIDKFNNEWQITLDGELICNFTSLSSEIGNSTCTNLAIDPDENIWVAHDGNKITKINANTKTKINTFTLGIEQDFNTEKHLSFIYFYNREKNTKEWLAIAYYNYEKTLYYTTLNGDIKTAIALPTKLNIIQSPPTRENKTNLQFTGKGDFTGYEWKRVFNKLLYNNNPQIQFKVSITKNIKNAPQSIFTVSVPVQYLTNNTWHMITCTLKNKLATIYIDTQERDKKAIPLNYKLDSFKKNDLYIGTPAGKFTNYNTEINTKSLIYNGRINDIKIYDYAIDSSLLPVFVREKFIGEDLYWNIPTTTLQYVEEIEKFFKHKIPGIKSTFFNIKISGSGAYNEQLKQTIETHIRYFIEQIKPSYSELLTIQWVD